MDKKNPLMLTIKRLDKEWSKYLRRISYETGMPENYTRIIMYLNRNSGASQKMVAEVCDMTYAAISQIIKEMYLSGYVIKQTDKKDLRSTKLYLTDKAEKKVDIIRSRIHDADRFVTDTISAEKEADIVETLNILIQSIGGELNA